MDLGTLICSWSDTPLLCIILLLTVGVIFVNGWTDAPNAVATCIATRAIPPRAAITLSAVGNFLGVFCMTKINAAVAFTIRDLADFGNKPSLAAAALCAALFAIILWAVAAWCFGIPTSESHALIAGLTGAAVALRGWRGTVQVGAWLKVLYGLGASVFLGAALGFLCTRLVERLFQRYDRRKTDCFFRHSQILGSFMMSFMHGAQDGQKFLGILLLGITIGSGGSAVTLGTWAPLLCSVVMSFGTSLGGGRIIKSVGMDMVKLTPHQGFCADFAAALGTGYREEELRYCDYYLARLVPLAVEPELKVKVAVALMELTPSRTIAL